MACLAALAMPESEPDPGPAPWGAIYRRTRQLAAYLNVPPVSP